MIGLILSLLLTTEQPKYYVTFYSYQGPTNVYGRPKPQESHSFVRFTKKQGNETLQTVDISWCPVDGKVFGGVKSGSNKSLEETLKDIDNSNINIKNFGTYEIERHLFQKALKHKNLLESGNVKYTALDSSLRPLAKNCIHAISDITEHKLITGKERGHKATELIVNHFKRLNLLH